MKKILFLVITVMLVGGMVVAQDKQEKPKRQTAGTKSTQATQSEQSTQSTQSKQTTQSTQSTQSKQTTQPTQPTQPPKTRRSRPKTQQTQPAQPMPPTEQPVPTQPVPTESVSTQPVSTQPVSTEPAPQEKPVQPGETNIGKVYIPKDFVHSGTDYTKGNYFISLYEKDGVPWFKIFSNKKELLFEEMAVVKPYQGKARRVKLRVRKDFLKDYEYFRVQVIKPESDLILFFLVKQKQVPVPAEAPTEIPAEKIEE